MRSNVPVEVTAVLEDLAAQAAAVDSFVFPGLVSLYDGHAICTNQQTTATGSGFSSSCWCALCWGFHIWRKGNAGRVSFIKRFYFCWNQKIIIMLSQNHLVSQYPGSAAFWSLWFRTLACRESSPHRSTTYSTQEASTVLSWSGQLKFLLYRMRA